MPTATRTLSVVIPCYEEQETIAEIIRRLREVTLPNAWILEIIVIDDGSGPQTRKILSALEKEVRVFYRDKNGGKGAAVKDGLRIASGEYCLVQDADLELDPQDIISLLAPIDSGDVQAVFGYRELANSAIVPNQTLYVGGKVVSYMFNIAFGTAFKDIPCGYKLFPRSCIPALLATPSTDFVFDAIEMTSIIALQNSIAQVPVRYIPRSRSQGKKIRFKHGVYTVLAILFIRFGIHRDPVPKELQRLIRYSAVGLVTVGINLALFSFLTLSWHIWYVASSSIAFVVSYGANFSLHKLWTFENRNIAASRKQLLLHVPLALCNLVFSAGLLYALVQYLRLPHIGAQAVTLCIIAAESFILQSKYIF